MHDSSLIGALGGFLILCLLFLAGCVVFRIADRILFGNWK